MRIIYVLLSPTFGMHRYTADLANRAAAGAFSTGAKPDVHVVTTTGFPDAAYGPSITIHTPLSSTGTGFSTEGAAIGTLRRTIRAITQLAAGQTENHEAAEPVIVHITGVHLWNVSLVRTLIAQGIPVVHTLHDLQAHSGVRFGSLIPRWNGLVIRAGAHILVHGRRYRTQLLDQGVLPDRVTYAPLLHGFWKFGAGPDENMSARLYAAELDRAAQRCKDDIRSVVLFFGRVEAYKGVDTLLSAWSQLGGDCPDARLVVAGAWLRDVEPPADLHNVEFRNYLITDDEAIDLFRSAMLLVLPYEDATQSALIAASYAFGLPVVVTDSGALPEYVIPGKTGWVVPVRDPMQLSAVLREAIANRSHLASMGANGRRWYEEQRIVEAETLSEMYRDLIHHKAAR